MTRGASAEFLGLVVAVVMGGACSRAPPAPKVTVDATRCSFGKLWLGEEVSHLFRVGNAGTLPLHLGEVRSNCGCLVAKMETTQIAPGATTDVLLQFLADKSLGPIEKKLSIATDDPALPKLEFTLAAEVAALYEFDPPLLEADDVVLGDERRFQVRLRTSDGSPLHCAPPAALEAGFSASVTPVAGKGGAVDVELRFDGQAHVGTRLFHIVVPTDHARVAQARIPVKLTLVPRLLVEPADRVDFGTVRRAEGSRVELTVRVRGAQPLPPVRPILLALKPGAGALPFLHAQLTPTEPGRAWRLTVLLDPGATGRSIVGSIDLRLELPDEPPRTLTLTGTLVD